jgi:hypothetical protein
MQTAGPTPLRYYSSSRDRSRDRLDFRRPRRRSLRVWPFLLVVMLAAGAVVGVLALIGRVPGPGPATATLLPVNPPVGAEAAGGAAGRAGAAQPAGG